MSSPVIFVKGFSLIEIMLVMTLTFIVMLFVMPIGMSFYRAQLLTEATNTLVSNLRLAQSSALSGKNNDSFGVSVQEGEFVVFQGDSYGSRTVTEDTVFPVSSAVEVTGLTEVVFERWVGMPSATGTVTLSYGERQRTININSAGLISP